MTKRILLIMLVGFVGIGLVSFADGAFSGSSWSGLVFDPDVGFTDIDLGLEATYVIGDVAFSADSLVTLRGQWIWQGFAATGEVGAFHAQVHMLFSGSSATYLYGEIILNASIAGVDFAFYSAQLADTVYGGAADGFAIQAAGSVGSFGMVSVTEVGAQIEDDDFTGISIVHTSTGRERHYMTNPCVVGQGFTGQKFTLSHFDFGCSEEITVTVYFTCDGFYYFSVSVEGLTIGNLDWLTVDSELRFELTDRSLVFTPETSLGDIVCFQVHASLDNKANMMSIDAIDIDGIEFTCQIGPVTVRDVTLFSSCELGLTTERYGSVVLPIANILAKGMDYYPDYWEMFSIAYAGAGCCEGEYNFLANVYFDEDSTSLFDWAMTHIEATIPYGESLAFTLGMEVAADGLDYLGFGFEVAW